MKGMRSSIRQVLGALELHKSSPVDILLVLNGDGSGNTFQKDARRVIGLFIKQSDTPITVDEARMTVEVHGTASITFHLVYPDGYKGWWGSILGYKFEGASVLCDSLTEIDLSNIRSRVTGDNTHKS